MNKSIYMDQAFPMLKSVIHFCLLKLISKELQEFP